jgi:hypothetical protein
MTQGINYMIKYQTIEEYLRYNAVDENLAELIEKELKDVVKLEKEIHTLEGREEALSEQLYFARENFENIRLHLEQSKSAKQAREAFAFVMENGYFEL